jgi:hypothetical protein
MLACIAPEQFRPNRVTYAAATPNTVMSNTLFYRCGYSVGRISTMGVYITFDIRASPTDAAGSFGRAGSLCFQAESADNARAISALKNIERQMLQLLGDSDRASVAALGAALETGELRGVLPSSADGKSGLHHLVLKVPGVWQSADAQGLVYKLVPITHRS